MKSTTKFMTQLCAAMLVALGAWTASMAPAHAIDFYNLRVADFPAHVRAIVFPSGNRIDSSSSTCWGKWCVHFGSEPPAARLAPHGIIKIDPLECKNPVDGVFECSLYLQHSTDAGSITVVGPDGNSFLHISIQFPQDLILE